MINECKNTIVETAINSSQIDINSQSFAVITAIFKKLKKADLKNAKFATKHIGSVLHTFRVRNYAQRAVASPQNSLNMEELVHELNEPVYTAKIYFPLFNGYLINFVLGYVLENLRLKIEKLRYLDSKKITSRGIKELRVGLNPGLERKDQTNQIN